MFHFENKTIWTSEFSQCVTPKYECYLVEKKTLLLIFSSIPISSTRNMFMRTYASSRVKRKSFYRKSELQIFCWFPAAIVVDQNGTPIWRLHTKLYKVASNVLANNSETVGHKDLRLGQIFYILVFHNISFSGFFHWTVPIYFFVAWQWKRSIERDIEKAFKRSSLSWYWNVYKPSLNKLPIKRWIIHTKFKTCFKYDVSFKC